MRLLAHRGDHRADPENTLAAFRAALAIPGVDGIELDVRASAEGTAVVIHDATLTRVQRRRIRASRLTVTELGVFGVPTLADVLAAAPGAYLDVELKEDLGEAAVEPIRAARGRVGGGVERVVVSSFDRRALAVVRRLVPAWPTWLLTAWLSDRAIGAAADLGCAGIAAEWHRIDERRAARARAAGLDLAAWTVRDAAVRDRLAALGVVAACVEGDALPG